MGWEFLDLVPEDTNGQSKKDQTSIFFLPRHSDTRLLSCIHKPFLHRSEIILNNNDFGLSYYGKADE